MRTPAPLLILAASACATAQTDRPTLVSAAAPGVRSIRGDALSARIRFLGDDLLEGRFTGSRGHAIAERYVASEMQALGLEPAGPGGSYLQVVPLRAGLKDPQRTALSVGGGGSEEALVNERDFVLSSDLRTPEVDVSAPLVFVGYGVVAPEYNYDDLAGADLKGKIAVLFSGAPLSDREDFFPPIAHAVLADGRTKIRRLAERGAVGMITVFRAEDEERLPWARVATSSRLEQMSWIKDGEPGASPAGVPLRGFVHAKAFEKILARAGVEGGLPLLEQKAKANALRPFDIGATLHGRLATGFRSLTSGNVAGILRGSDPKLRDEYVVYSAHLDHLGIGAPIDGDSLYNGALDNASGVASVLEVARAFVALPQRPARSILFLAVTGEERGLLGSEYFARNPTVPASSLVADINIDMIVAQHPLLDVVALGAEHSTLSEPVREAASALHLALSPDPQPKQMSFIRSDQYSFVKRGVPSISIGPGELDAAGNREANIALRKRWVATRYHSPKDEWDPTYDYEAMAQVARVDFLIGLSVANRAERPHWNAGDFFARFPEKAPGAPTAPATSPTDPPPTPPPTPERKPNSLLRNVVGGLALGVGLACLVGAVGASGDEQDRKGVAATDAALMVLAPLGGPGAFSMIAGFGSLGVYNLVNHNSSAARRWINGGGMLLTFAAAGVEAGLSRRARSGGREQKTSWWMTPGGGGFASRF